MTYGAEIDESIRADVNWPSRLGHHLGCEVVNEAIGGSSNDRIVRTTMQFIAQYLIDCRDPNDLFVTIGWSNPARREFCWADPVKQRDEGDFYFQVLPTWRPKSLEKIHDFYYGHHHHEREAETRYLIDIHTLQNTLKLYGIRYLFCKGLPSAPFHSDVLKHRETTNLEALLDTSRFYGFSMNHSFYNKAKHEWAVPMGPGGHPLEEGHQLWGDLLFEFIQNGNLL